MATVTIIDDDLDLLTLFRTLIDPFHEVRTYADAVSALTGMRENKPDLVLLDISLGEANGVDVLHQLRALDGLAAVPVIAVTSHTLRSERAKYLAEGFTDFIAKPLTDHGVLMSVVETALRGESVPDNDDDLGVAPAPARLPVEQMVALVLAALDAGEIERAKTLLRSMLPAG